MKRFLKHFIIGGVLAGVIVSFYIKTSHAAFSEHQRFDSYVDRLSEVDALINEDVLKARSRLLENYDTFPENIVTMRNLIHDAEWMPSYVSENGQRTIREKLGNLSRVLDEKEELLEQFKSQNAVLANSLRYLPTAGTELLQQISGNPGNRDLEIQLNELLRQVLVNSMHPNDDRVAEIRQSLVRLSTWRTQHRDDPRNPALSTLMAHAKSVVDHMPKVENLTQEILSVPTNTEIEGIFSIYNEEFSNALHSADHYRVGLYVLCIVLIIGIGATVYALDVTNQRLEQRVTERTSELSSKNDELERQIAERMRIETEIEAMSKKLMDTSRRAGMAEVATSVLHNVGNVLNSVNISCSVMSDIMRKSRVSNVGRTAALLQENAADLAAFVTLDPAGQKLPDFLSKLSVRLGEEQTGILDELQSLGKNIDHIREIVCMQQSYASVGGVREKLLIKDLVEDALQMNGAGLARHDVEIIRDYEAVPPVSIDKHKVLQILVNLVRNAKHALSDAARDDKRLTIRIESDDQQVRVRVADNGVGIPSENLTRIFAHGFTTKKNGHGFGLHSSVLAAQDMGGRLMVQSEGLGTGASFTLELPREFNQVTAV